MKTRLRLVVVALALATPPTHAAKVPKVTAGPDVFVTAAAMEAPIAEVTVFSDRARIARRGKAEGAVGVRAVRLPDLPGATLIDTLRVSAKGAEVLRVEAVPVNQPRRAIGQAEALVVKLEGIARELARHDARRAVLLDETQFLDGLAPKPLAPEGDRKATPPVDPAAWAGVRDFVHSRRTALVGELRAMDATRDAIRTRADALKAELRRFNQEAFTNRRSVQVVALIDASRATPELTVEYFVPGASWRPAYTTELDDDGRTLTIRTAGLVQQATGEDWSDVDLALSTAIPGQGIEAPTLLTWTLGEAKDFTPRPQAKQARAAQTLAPPTARQTPAELAQAQRRQTLQQRVQAALQVGAQDPSATYAGAEPSRDVDAMGVGGLGMRGSGSGGGGVAFGSAAGVGRGSSSHSYGAKAKPRRSRAMAPGAPPPMAEASIAMDDAAPYEGMDAPRDGRRAQAVGLDLFEPAPAQGPTFNDPSLPAVVAGGLDYVYRATTQVTVPSSPEQHSVPLSAARYPVQPFYEAAPALEPTAFLKATVKNSGALPLLGGPVDIFVGADYVGTGQIDTTGVGGDLQLPLGADEDIKFVRRVIPNTKTEGVFSKEDVTGYRTEIDVVNHKRRAITVRVVEQFPISDVQDLKIERGKLSLKPSEGPDDTGIMAFEVKLKPGEKQTLSFSYRIRRPENWRLHQR